MVSVTLICHIELMGNKYKVGACVNGHYQSLN